jgi:hypothetical protein
MRLDEAGLLSVFDLNRERIYAVAAKVYGATKAKIRAVAKALCFRACTDCKSAVECDPDKNWIEEALAILERPGRAD